MLTKSTGAIARKCGRARNILRVRAQTNHLAVLYVPPTQTVAESAFLFKNGCFLVDEQL